MIRIEIDSWKRLRRVYDGFGVSKRDALCVDILDLF